MDGLDLWGYGLALPCAEHTGRDLKLERLEVADIVHSKHSPDGVRRQQNTYLSVFVKPVVSGNKNELKKDLGE